VKTKDRRRIGRAATRAAWIWRPPEAPGLAALGSAEGRRRFAKYWVTDNLQNGLDIATHFGLRLAPVETASGIGARLGRFSVPRYHAVMAKRARKNLRKLRPDLSEAEVDAMLARNWDNIGRLMTEFSTLDRLLPKGRIVFAPGAEEVLAVARSRPSILLALHLGNWEVLAPAVISRGIVPTDNFAPQGSRARNWIAHKVRTRIGLKFLPPGMAAIRPALKILKEGGSISMFGDEAVGNRIMAPFFGRKPHLEGNLAIAVRLARHTGAVIVPGYALREGGCRFSIHGLTPVELPPEESPGARLVEDVMLLNGMIEPVIRAHLDQWFYLGSKLN